jgi:hypothetical protein
MSEAARALGGDLGSIPLIDIMPFAPGMCPAASLPQRRTSHALWFCQGAVAGTSVRRANSPLDCLLTLLTLHDALEAGQDIHGMVAMAPGRRLRHLAECVIGLFKTEVINQIGP